MGPRARSNRLVGGHGAGAWAQTSRRSASCCSRCIRELCETTSQCENFSARTHTRGQSFSWCMCQRATAPAAGSRCKVNCKVQGQGRQRLALPAVCCKPAHASAQRVELSESQAPAVPYSSCTAAPSSQQYSPHLAQHSLQNCSHYGPPS